LRRTDTPRGGLSGAFHLQKSRSHHTEAQGVSKRSQHVEEGHYHPCTFSSSLSGPPQAPKTGSGAAEIFFWLFFRPNST
jgi:hypothetical protein